MPEYTDILGNAQEAVGVFMAEDRTYLDMSGKLHEAEGVFISPTLLYDDLSGNAREAQGVFIVGGGLPSDQAIVENGDIVTATGGQTIDIGVAAGVPSFTVRSNPFWDPFTMTVGDDGGESRGYVAAAYGSVSNQPVAGATIDYIYTQGGNGLTIRINMGDIATNNISLTSLIGIGGVTYSPSSVQFYQEGGEEPEGQLDIYIDAGPFAWTVGQQVPIVIIP